MMDEEQLNKVMAQFRMLGDRRGSDALTQCRLLAHFWQDPKSLTYMADNLGSSPQLLKKYARAGAVLQEKVFEDDAPQSIDFYYQLSYWPQEQWEVIADLALIGGLDATGLKKLRGFAEKLKGAEKHWCPYCGHGGYSMSDLSWIPRTKTE